MGEDVIGLEIKNDGGIKFIGKEGEFTPMEDNDPYPNNEWAGNTYTNNSIIFGKATDSGSAGYGLKLSGNLENMNFINNSSISGEETVNGYGIYNAGGIIGSIENNGSIFGKGYVNYGIYNENSSIGSLLNSGVMSGYYGIYNHSKDSNSKSNISSLINNGSITGSSGGYGIYNHSEGSDLKSTESLISNIGSILNIGTIYGDTWGIDNASSLGTSSIGSIENIGIISGGAFGIENVSSSTSSKGSIESLLNIGSISSNNYGIMNFSTSAGTSSIGIIENNGNIGSLVGSYGIYNYSSNQDSNSSIEIIKNTGIISGTETGTGSGFGIFNYTYISGTSTIKSLINSGVIYGSINAVKNEGGTINNAYNYGVLVTDGTSVVENVSSGAVNSIEKYGLAFKVEDNGSYTLDPTYSGEFGKAYIDTKVVIGYGINSDGTFNFDDPTKDIYTIINAKAKDDVKEPSNSVSGTESLTLKNGKLTYYDSDEISGGKYKEENIDSTKKYILNGIENTLEVIGSGNELNNLIINAYKKAVVMNENRSTLTLNDTAVNGVSSTVSIGGNGNTLTVKGNSLINTREGETAITITGKNNVVTLEGNAVVNGAITSNEGNNNILALNGTGKYGMNMFHDISGFENMSIDKNVTFFENAKVTGTEIVTVEETGVLSLRLKKKEEKTKTYGDSSSSIPTAIHAFSGTSGTTIKGNSPEEAGTLNFITNGIGREINVDMTNITLENMKIKASSIIDSAEIRDGYIHLGAGSDLNGIVNPRINKYNSLNKVYKSIYNSTGENIDGLRDILNMTFLRKNYDYTNGADEEQLRNLMTYLNSIYTGTPYPYSSELSRRSAGMFRDIITGNEFRPNLDNWLIMGGLTHADGGTKDTYYGQNYHGFDTGTSDTEADMKLTGAYMLAKYGYSENISLGLTVGGNKSETEMSMSKVKGNSGYLGAFAENYRGNLTVKTGAGIQYSEYDADRSTIGGHSYSDKYSDMTYDIYLNGRYSHQVGDNLFLEPYVILSYTYIDQDGADEGNKTLAIETDSKSFDYTVGKVGVDLKKIIPHEKGKSSLTAGVSYTKILDGAEEEYITGRFKGSTTDFDILVAHKNEHSIGLNAKYALELENGVLFDVKGTYSVERDSHNGSSKNKNKGEWIVGAGMGYKF
ncbi:MAG: autotransporter domain-containing protein [Fusobacterium ulcerans]|uniref:autotransporter domain-containing protein n=1 Tax=Fusobacterium ulcerans TaxID=861 RepID=UPI003A8B42E8